MTQQKLTETTENWSALTRTPNFGIFIPLHSSLFGSHSTLFRLVLVPFLFISFHSGVVLSHSDIIIPVYSGIFRPIPVFSNTPYKLITIRISNIIC